MLNLSLSFFQTVSLLLNLLVIQIESFGLTCIPSVIIACIWYDSLNTKISEWNLVHTFMGTQLSLGSYAVRLSPLMNLTACDPILAQSWIPAWPPCLFSKKKMKEQHDNLFSPKDWEVQVSCCACSEPLSVSTNSILAPTPVFLNCQEQLNSISELKVEWS